MVARVVEEDVVDLVLTEALLQVLLGVDWDSISLLGNLSPPVICKILPMHKGF